MKYFFYPFFFLFFVPLFSAAQTGSVLRVDSGATGLNNGSSWANAFTQLNTALQFAQSGDSIWVASGEYLPTDNGNRDSSFVLKNGVCIFGGFNGSETALFQRNLQQNPTVLSGDIGVANDNSDNSYNVIYGIGLDTNTVINGFIIEMGSANSTNPADSNFRHKSGGGMFLVPFTNLDCTPVVENCIFKNNYVTATGPDIFAGGTIQADVNPRIRHCIFTNENITISSGLQYWIRKQNTQRAIQITNCLFNGNNSHIGLLFQGGDLTFELDRDTFSCPGDMGGSVSVLGTGLGAIDTKVSNCFFYQNKRCRLLVSTGGESEYILKGNTFADNRDLEISFDYTESAKLVVENNTFVNNIASAINSLGGLLLTGNQIDSSQIIVRSNRIKAVNNRFSKNNIRIESEYLSEIQSLHFRDTLDIAYSNLTFQSCSFIDCFPGTYSNALFQPKDSLVFNSCLFTAAEGAYSILDTLVPPFPYVEASHCIFADTTCFSVLYDAPSSFCNGNNLFGASIRFYDEQDGDFRLFPCSDGIDSGDAITIAEAGILTDLSGAPRVANGFPDVGALETADSPIPFQLYSELFPASSTTASDGAIVVDVISGGVGPYTFLWSTGVTGASVENISAGDYTLTITDTNGCSESHNFILSVVGVSEQKIKPVNLLKNPINSGDVLYFSQPISGWVEIRDISGRHIGQYLCSEGKVVEPLYLSAGVYTLTFCDEKINSGLVKGCFTKVLQIYSPK